MDYQKIGLKAGLEIHQQLDTEKKLFCNCKSRLSQDKHTKTISRTLKPVTGETGEVDVAASHELLKNKVFEYLVYPEETCEVETDEEPPHEMNPDALSIGLQIATMLNCKIPDEIHIMRKTVVDGSNTAGFQRTAIVGMKGFIETSFGKVGIANVSVEEDSAQIISKDGNKIIYGLDRLGIPLVEIGTEPDIKTPEQAKEAAEKLGLIIRSTGSVKRGLGTIRQDVNVSIAGGDRIEIKGAQDLKLLPKLVESEAIRQIKLIEITEKIKNLKAHPRDPTDVSDVFKNTKSKLVSAVLLSGGKIFGSKLENFAGLLGIEIQTNKRFGTEVSEYAKICGVKGLMHSDEDLKTKYGIDESEILGVKNELEIKEKDAFILIGDNRDTAKKAIAEAMRRAYMQMQKPVPREVRKAEEDAATTFMRPLPGAARLYPETDSRPIKADKSILKFLKENLPELWEDKIKRFVKDYKLNQDVASQLVKSYNPELFERIIGLGFGPNLVFRALASMASDIEKLPSAEKLTDDIIFEVFKKSPKTISKEAVYEALKSAAITGKAEKAEAVVSEEELKKTVKAVIAKNKDALQKRNPEQVLMGEVMKEVRGKASGSLVMKILKEELEKGK